MKIIKYALITCIITSGFITQAQEDASKKEVSMNHRAEMIAELGLSEEQQTQLEALKAQTKEKIASIKEDTSLDDATRKEKIKSIKSEHHNAMSEILTEEQMEQLLAKKAEWKEEKGNKTHGEIAAKKTQKMKELLNLTPEQEEQVRTLNLKVIMKIDAIKNDDSMTPEKKKEFIKGNREDHKRVMESILTPEQLKIYEEHLAARKKMKAEKKNEATPSVKEKATE